MKFVENNTPFAVGACFAYYMRGLKEQRPMDHRCASAVYLEGALRWRHPRLVLPPGEGVAPSRLYTASQALVIRTLMRTTALRSTWWQA